MKGRPIARLFFTPVGLAKPVGREPVGAGNSGLCLRVLPWCLVGSATLLSFFLVFGFVTPRAKPMAILFFAPPALVVPVGNEPVGNTPVGDAPVGDAPVGSEPVGKMPVGNAELCLRVLPWCLLGSAALLSFFLVFGFVTSSKPMAILFFAPPALVVPVGNELDGEVPVANEPVE